jgi:hypothetical protein
MHMAKAPDRKTTCEPAADRGGGNVIDFLEASRAIVLKRSLARAIALARAELGGRPDRPGGGRAA